HVSGEVIFDVRSMSLPDRLSMPPMIEAVGHYDGVRFFADRASAARPGFVLTRQNISTILDICRCLDGLPLAIEFAAALVRVMPVEEIAGRLTDRFRLLAGASRTALPRHHDTLRAAFDWSYELLSAAEQHLLRRLAVFASGWTLNAAEAV